MECVIHTRNRAIGLDEEISDLADYDYFSVLPNFAQTVGLISRQSSSMLKEGRQKQIEENLIEVLSSKKKDSFFGQSDEFLLYDFKNIKPVLYEVCGFNCLVNTKGNDYGCLELVKAFYQRDHGFVRDDFDKLEMYTNYLICSYYEGEATHLYTDERMAGQIIAKFNELCFEKCGANISVVEL